MDQSAYWVPTVSYHCPDAPADGHVVYYKGAHEMRPAKHFVNNALPDCGTPELPFVPGGGGVFDGGGASGRASFDGASAILFVALAVAWLFRDRVGRPGS